MRSPWTSEQFLAECQRLAGEDWEEYSALYSFEAACEEGFSPAGAVKDCKEWLEG